MKKILLLFLITSSLGFIKPKKQFITRNGQVTFFSYASAENIKAENNFKFQTQTIWNTNQIYKRRFYTSWCYQAFKN